MMRQPNNLVWYDFLQVIDEGGQAQVRMVRNRGTGELFAGKFLREHWDPIARERFKEEGLRQARVAGPGVVPVVGFNFDAREPFIVLEYMPRGSLAKELAKRGRLPLLESLQTTREIASLLSHLHAKNVIHRDLKPGNVMRGADGRLRLNDLGLGATMAVGEFVAAAGFVGTPAYAAPEQRANYATPTSDIYALGVMLVEMVTGARTLVGTRIPVEAASLVASFTHADPAKRPSAHDAYHLITTAIAKVEDRERRQRKAAGQLFAVGATVGLLYLALK